MTPNMKRPQLSIVIPVYCEQDVLPMLIKRTLAALESLDRSFEIVFVDDGSHDRSAAIIREAIDKHPEIRLVKLSRNYGLQHAVSAGLAHAKGEIVGLMDGDLQDPPELFAQMLEKLEEGHDVIYMLKRSRRESFIRKLGFSAFYWLFAKLSKTTIPHTAGLFSLMRRRVVDAIVALPERNKFIPGLRAWVGYRQVGIEFDREGRAAGQPAQSLGRLVRLAFDAIYSFTDIPLKLALLLGLSTAILSILGVFIVAGLRIFTSLAIPGWASTLVSIFFMGGVQLICVGILGEYISRIYDEVRRRPPYLVDRVIEHSSTEKENESE